MIEIKTTDEIIKEHPTEGIEKHKGILKKWVSQQDILRELMKAEFWEGKMQLMVDLGIIDLLEESPKGKIILGDALYRLREEL